jgi:hypothetical protein
MILKWNYKRYEEYGGGWIRVAQDRDQWRILVNMVLKLPVSEDA